MKYQAMIVKSVISPVMISSGLGLGYMLSICVISADANKVNIYYGNLCVLFFSGLANPVKLAVTGNKKKEEILK